MMQESLQLNDPVYWRISAKWASHIIDCTLNGIQTGCGGRCCRTKTFWPPSATDGDACGNLGPDGCVLGDDRPVTCLLYPFRLVNGTLVLHGKTLIPKSGNCAPCHHKGTQTIAEALHGSFTTLFGAEQADRIVADVLAGRDPIVEVPPDTLRALEAERAWEAANRLPPGRSVMITHTP